MLGPRGVFKPVRLCIHRFLTFECRYVKIYLLWIFNQSILSPRSNDISWLRCWLLGLMHNQLSRTSAQRRFQTCTNASTRVKIRLQQDKQINFSCYDGLVDNGYWDTEQKRNCHVNPVFGICLGALQGIASVGCCHHPNLT